MITLGLVDSVDTNGVYVTMPGSRGVLRGPYKALSTVAAGTTVLVASTDDGEQVVVGTADGGEGVYNVRAFGATGDGVTDDTSAVLAAFAAVSATRQGGSVHFPQGVYRITASIVIETENIRVTGVGHRNLQVPLDTTGFTMASTILNDHSGPLFKISHSNPTNGFSVADITLVGKVAYRHTTGHAAFDFDLAGDGAFMRDFTIERTSITHFGAGILARASSTEGTGSESQIATIRVTDCNIMHNKWIAQCLNDIRWNGFWFRGNDCGQNGYQVGEGGLSLPGCCDVSIVDNLMEGQRDPINILDGRRSLVIKNNYFEANVGDACINVEGQATPVDIGPNLFYNVTTTHKVLLNRVVGQCLDPYFSTGAAKLHPRPFTNAATGYDEYRIDSDQLDDATWVYSDRPHADDLTRPRALAWAWGSVSDPYPSPAFVPAVTGGKEPGNVPVMLETMAGPLGLVSTSVSLSGSVGDILAVTWAFRRIDTPVANFEPYIALRPDDAANEYAESPIYSAVSHFRDDEWIVSTVAMRLTHSCTSVVGYLYPYGATGSAVGLQAEMLRPVFYTAADINDVKPWLPGYGIASAAPTNGTWGVGDEMRNETPSSGGAYKWVCTTAGTPGTWKSVNLT